MPLKRYSALCVAIIAGACAAPTADTNPGEQATAHQQIKTGNGEQNYIILENAKRDGAVFTFSEATIDAPGWLVMHPFRNGVPVQTEYVGATLIPKGKSTDVQITVDTAPDPGEMFIVMLHYDANDDGVFDFNDGVTVPDAPVFEDGVLIALRFAAP